MNLVVATIANYMLYFRCVSYDIFQPSAHRSFQKYDNLLYQCTNVIDRYKYTSVSTKIQSNLSLETALSDKKMWSLKTSGLLTQVNYRK